MSETLRKFTLLLARVTFGLLFPVWLIWSMLTSHYQLQRENAVDKSFDQLAQSLDCLENYHDDRVFFHALFQKNFVMADNSLEPAGQLEKKISALRRMFPDKLKFIVWNNKGEINKQLTDENRFQYLLKIMFSTIHELKELFAKGSSSDPSDSEIVAAKLTLLRGYFGQFLLQKLMFEPLKPEYLGRCMFVSEETDKRLLWYYPGQNFSLACFVDASLLGKNIGPRLLVTRFNSRSRLTRLAFLQTGTYQGFGLPGLPFEEAEIKIEACKFESYAIASRESKNFLVHFRQVSPGLIVSSYQFNRHLLQPDESAVRFLFRSGRWLVLFGFLIFCLRLRYQYFALSVQQKIMLLFLFANGLPLLILVSTGYEFFNEKKKDLINATHQESMRILKEFDVRFPEIASNLANRLNVFIDEHNRQYGSQQWPEHEIQDLQKLVREIAPQEAILCDANGKEVFHLATNSSPSEKMVKDMFVQALNFFNSDSLNQSTKVKSSMLDKVSSTDLILHDFLWNMGRFRILSSGDVGRLSYIKLLGGNNTSNDEQFRVWGGLGISWNPVVFMRTFIERKLSETAKEAAPRRLIILEKQSEDIFALQPVGNREIKRLLKQTQSRKFVTREDIVVDGKKYLFTSLAGNEIADGILAALYPQSIIEKSIKRLQLTILLVGLVLFFVLMQIVRVFARRLLLPVEALGDGIERMRHRDFDYRIDFHSQDEFGELIKTFNSTLAGMKELAVGTAVQESLLPDSTFSRFNTKLFARSLFMSKMGGDYFDYFELPGQRLCIFFGDVAGHGIPAAMIMAMAKAVITAAAKDFVSPQAVLTSTNEVLLELKKRHWRRMMTAQCFDFNLVTGEFSFANAGHCYPAVVSRGGQTVALLEINGMPLGSSSRKPYEAIYGRLKPGETLILYTDGIIEAINQAGEVFNFDRFVLLLQSSWAEDLEVYWQNINEANKVWAVSQDDDLTFLMLRLEAGHE